MDTARIRLPRPRNSTSNNTQHNEMNNNGRRSSASSQRYTFPNVTPPSLIQSQRRYAQNYQQQQQQQQQQHQPPMMGTVSSNSMSPHAEIPISAIAAGPSNVDINELKRSPAAMVPSTNIATAADADVNTKRVEIVSKKLCILFVLRGLTM